MKRVTNLLNWLSNLAPLVIAITGLTNFHDLDGSLFFRIPQQKATSTLLLTSPCLVITLKKGNVIPIFKAIYYPS